MDCSTQYQSLQNKTQSSKTTVKKCKNVHFSSFSARKFTNAQNTTVNMYIHSSYQYSTAYTRIVYTKTQQTEWNRGQNQVKKVHENIERAQKGFFFHASLLHYHLLTISYST
ncbi:hypothetical protein ACKWTF_006871 [Chironomus riparius]